MILVYVRGAAANLPGRGYNLLKGASVDKLGNSLRALMPGLISWSYAFAKGELTLRVTDGESIPVELSLYGTVEVAADAGSS